MARIGYFIKNVRENDNPTAANDATTIDVGFEGTPDFAGDNYYMFYQWPSSLSAASATGAAQGAIAAGTLINDFPHIARAMAAEPTSGFDFLHVTTELQQVYDNTTATNAGSGDNFRLRVGKRIYIFGYAYTSGGVIDPATATITWKD